MKSSRTKTCSLFLSFTLILLASCSPGKGIPQSPVPATVIQPTATTGIQVATPIVDTWVSILWVSDPSLPQYDPKSSQYAAFPNAVKQLSGMGSGANDAADDLAVAISYPRQDSYLAAQALLTLGSDITGITIPVLLHNLLDQKAETRVYSVILLGSVGKQASCAIWEYWPSFVGR